MSSINVCDVSKIFADSQNGVVLEKIKRNAYAFMRFFEMCVSAKLLPKGLSSVNRRAVMNEICRAYGFTDYAEVENCSAKQLKVFDQPILNAPKVDWTRPLKNSNYTFEASDIESANYINNKLFRYILKKGIHFDTFDVLLSFYSYPINKRDVSINNKGYSKPILNSDDLGWELWLSNVAQLAYSHHKFNKDDLSLTLSLSDLGKPNQSMNELNAALAACPAKLLGGKIKVNNDQQQVTFFFTKTNLNRIQDKKERISFVERLGLNNFTANSSFATRL